MKLRPLIGAVLSLLLSGTVLHATETGLFAPTALLVFLTLYVCYFYVVDAYVHTYRCSWIQLVLFGVALHGIVIAGFFQGGLLGLRTDEWLSLIVAWVQSGFALLLAYLCLRTVSFEHTKHYSFKKALLWLGVYFILMSPTKQLGIVPVLQVIQNTPVIALGALGVAAVLFVVAKRPHRPTNRTTSQLPSWIAYPFVAVACIPVAQLFIYFAIATIVVGILCLMRFGEETV